MFNVFLAAALHVILVRCIKAFEDETIVRQFLQLNCSGVVGTTEQKPFACVRRAVWVMLYVNDAGVVSESGEVFTKMTTVTGTVFTVGSPTVSELKTKAMLL